jgi:mRNA deadenylase 3'-5' endonuclease subunit Ccr4
MPQSLFKDEGKRNTKHKKVPPRTFVFFHCYDILCNEEKWKNREGMEVLGRKAAEATMIDVHATSDDDNKRSSTPHSVANTRRPWHGKKAAKDMRGRKTGDDDIEKGVEKLVNARLEANADRNMARSKEAKDETRMTALEERLAAAEERKVALEEQKVALESQKVANEEYQRLLDEENELFFKDTSKMNERQKEYVNLARDVLAKKEHWQTI